MYCSASEPRNGTLTPIRDPDKPTGTAVLGVLIFKTAAVFQEGLKRLIYPNQTPSWNTSEGIVLPTLIRAFSFPVSALPNVPPGQARSLPRPPSTTALYLMRLLAAPHWGHPIPSPRAQLDPHRDPFLLPSASMSCRVPKSPLCKLPPYLLLENPCLGNFLLCWDHIIPSLTPRREKKTKKQIGATCFGSHRFLTGQIQEGTSQACSRWGSVYPPANLLAEGSALPVQPMGNIILRCSRIERC